MMGTEHSAESLRDDYLRRLDEALTGVPYGVAAELREGIAEELAGLDDAVTAARIAVLGPPSDIARAAVEAGAAVPPAAAPALPADPPLAVSPLAETRGYAIVAALMLGLGGIVVPLVGWIVGVVLVATSRLWRTAEKVWGILSVPVGMILFVLVSMLFSVLTAKDSVNPLVPGLYDLIWSSLLVGAIIAPFSALWLVLRLRGRVHPPAGQPS